jgi:hypothetical protein
VVENAKGTQERGVKSPSALFSFLETTIATAHVHSSRRSLFIFKKNIYVMCLYIYIPEFLRCHSNSCTQHLPFCIQLLHHVYASLLTCEELHGSFTLAWYLLWKDLLYGACPLPMAVRLHSSEAWSSTNPPLPRPTIDSLV